MKPLADHGTTARAKGRPSASIKGCPCRPCRDAENRYGKRRRYLNATGRTINVPAEPIAQHLDNLFAAGAGWTQLAAATECSSSVLCSIRKRQQPIVRRTVANRILAVQPGDAIPPGRPVPAIGSIRRIQALLAAGHRCKDIAEASDLDGSTIRILLNDQPDKTTRHVAERLASGYSKLAATPGTFARSLNRATREGWHTIEYWEDVDRIDDPTFDPNARDSRAKAIGENALELIDQQGYTRRDAAARLGVSLSTLEVNIRRYRDELQEAA